MKDLIKYSSLLDFYFLLFTKKQQKYLDLYFYHDYSFAEIAQEYKISKAAIYDCISKAKKQLLKWEEKLKLKENYLKRTELYKQIRQEELKEKLYDIEKKQQRN